LYDAIPLNGEVPTRQSVRGTSASPATGRSEGASTLVRREAQSTGLWSTLPKGTARTVGLRDAKFPYKQTRRMSGQCVDSGARMLSTLRTLMRSGRHSLPRTGPDRLSVQAPSSSSLFRQACSVPNTLNKTTISLYVKATMTIRHWLIRKGKSSFCCLSSRC
jgi:hypothetical protein